MSRFDQPSGPGPDYWTSPLEELLEKELAVALRAFLARATGRGRALEALLIADRYQVTAGKTLAGRHASLAEESRQRRAELEQESVRRRRRFDEDWGERGQKRKDLIAGLQKAIALAKQQMRVELQPGGTIETDLRGQIDRLTSVAAARAFFEAIPGAVVGRAQQAWAQVLERVHARCLELLAPFFEATEAVAPPRR